MRMLWLHPVQHAQGQAVCCTMHTIPIDLSAMYIMHGSVSLYVAWCSHAECQAHCIARLALYHEQEQTNAVGLNSAILTRSVAVVQSSRSFTACLSYHCSFSGVLFSTQ